MCANVNPEPAEDQETARPTAPQGPTAAAKPTRPRALADLIPASLAKRKDLDEWWRDAVIYQIYPRSWADGNDDGIGDFAGVLERADYLAELGVDAVWFSPFYISPQLDTGYDVADYLQINPDYGTLEQFDQVIAALHERDIKVIIDVVPNHSSWDHAWFKAALAAEPGSPERDRYIFRQAGRAISRDHDENYAVQRPNNWGAMFGGPAWTSVYELTGKEQDRDWWYLHLFDPGQPDFDWTNPEVHALFRDYFRFWCERGVDGFRVDVAHGLVKAEGLPDDNIGPERWANSGEDAGKAPDQGPYFDQDGVHEIYREWRRVLDEYGRDRMMVAEAWVPDPDRNSYYVRADEMSQAFNFEVLKCPWHAGALRRTIKATMACNDKVGAPTTWVLSNHDVVRHASRYGYPVGANTEGGIGPSDPRPDRALGLSRALAFTSFLAALPGSFYVYQGEELGLPEVTDIPDDRREDPTWERNGHRVYGRDGCRVPIPWNDEGANAGFSLGSEAAGSWLPQPAGWSDLSVAKQNEDEASTLSYYRRLLCLRKQYQLGRSLLSWVDADADLLVVQLRGGMIRSGDASGGVRVLNGTGDSAIGSGGSRVIGGAIDTFGGSPVDNAGGNVRLGAEAEVVALINLGVGARPIPKSVLQETKAVLLDSLHPGGPSGTTSGAESNVGAAAIPQNVQPNQTLWLRL